MLVSELTERLTLKTWDEFAKKVTEAYDDAPKFDPKAVPHWKALIRAIEKQFDQIAKTKGKTGKQRYEIKYVDYQPYENADEVIADLKKNKRLLVSTEYNNHPVWSPEQNLKFRAVHDVFGHMQGLTAFSLKGEIRAYNQHIKTLPQAAIPAMFTEVIGQASYKMTTGDFPTQKVALLKQFDYVNIGQMRKEDMKKKVLSLI